MTTINIMPYLHQTRATLRETTETKLQAENIVTRELKPCEGSEKSEARVGVRLLKTKADKKKI